MSTEMVIPVLVAHRDNLSKATTFEEFREAQCKYIDFLIAKERAREAEFKACFDFAYPTESITRTRT